MIKKFGCVRCNLIDDLGKSHTYTPDLFDVKNNIVYEIKPSWKVNSPTPEMILKMKALSCLFVNQYLTDEDIDQCR